MKKLSIYIDEVGRGPLAGPVYVGLVLLTGKVSLLGYKDSKKCSPKLRETLYQKMLKEKNVRRVTAKCSHGCIDKKGLSSSIQAAIIKGLETLLAQYIQKDISGIKNIITHIGNKNITLILDGKFDFRLRKSLEIGVETIVHGDDLVPQISMASILAKVERDREMLKHHKKYPQYGFDQHKGYGTLAHRRAIQQYGPCAIHRKSFLTKLQPC